MTARRDEVLIEELKSLPPEQHAEVKDFVDFLKARRERARDAAARLFRLKRLARGARSRIAVAAGRSADLSMRD